MCVFVSVGVSISVRVTAGVSAGMSASYGFSSVVSVERRSGDRYSLCGGACEKCRSAF